MNDWDEKISRRHFAAIGASAAISIATGTGKAADGKRTVKRLRLGGTVFGEYDSPESWVEAHRNWGYTAAWCPLDADADDTEVESYRDAAARNDLLIAEVGAWSNPISRDDTERKDAIARCKRQLDLADRIGALCCANISGSRGEKWDGPHPDNLTDDTFGMIVEVTREIIDEVKPTRTYFTLETMPWTYPDSADSYLRLIKTIDRDRFAAHLDPVNLICSPQRYFKNADIIRECFAKLGPYIKSCHAKDIILRDTLTTHLDECEPGTGGLDYAVYLKELSRLSDVPLMMEHMREPEEYQRAGKHIRKVAQSLNLSFK
jgi:sugar phosphate isomerase/epimerase